MIPRYRQTRIRSRARGRYMTGVEDFTMNDILTLVKANLLPMEKLNLWLHLTNDKEVVPLVAEILVANGYQIEENQ